MRIEPFPKKDIAAQSVSTTEQPAEYQKHVVSLKDRLKQSAALNKPVEEKKEPEQQAQQQTTTEQPKPNAEEPKVEESATFDDFEKKVNEKLNETDAVEISEMIVQIGNIGRLFFIPGIYEGLMFPGQERNDIRDVVRRSIENEKQNKPQDEGFNNYDKRLFAKWPKLQGAIENVSYTEPEIKTLAKYVARQISDMTVSVWLHKHMWLLYLLYLESLHAKNIIGGRADDFFKKKFGMP